MILRRVWIAYVAYVHEGQDVGGRAVGRHWTERAAWRHANRVASLPTLIAESLRSSVVGYTIILEPRAVKEER